MSPLAPSPTTTRTRPFAALLAGLLLALSTVVGLPGPALAAGHHVVIEQYSYSPAGLTVEQGDTVTWTNHDDVAHDVLVTAGPDTFQSPMLQKGDSWSHTFTTAGSYSYICSVHPDMHGSVTAKAAPAPAPATSAPPTRSAPAQSVPAQTVAPTTPAASRAPKARQRHPKRHHTAAAAAGSGTDAQAVTTAPLATADTASLNPLLLVLGASVAVVVFCLLLMASRPVPQPVPVEVSDDDEDEWG